MAVAKPHLIAIGEPSELSRARGNESRPGKGIDRRPSPQLLAVRSIAAVRSASPSSFWCRQGKTIMNAFIKNIFASASAKNGGIVAAAKPVLKHASYTALKRAVKKRGFTCCAAAANTSSSAIPVLAASSCRPSHQKPRPTAGAFDEAVFIALLR